MMRKLLINLVGQQVLIVERNPLSNRNSQLRLNVDIKINIIAARVGKPSAN